MNASQRQKTKYFEQLIKGGAFNDEDGDTVVSNGGSTGGQEQTKSEPDKWVKPKMRNPKDRRKRIKKLPNRLIPFTTADKKNHEKWYPRRNLSNFPCPSKILLIGAPNCGKTSTAMNIILRSRPLYNNIYVVQEYQNSKEWDDINPTEYLTEIPEPEFFDGSKKNLIILEDFETDKKDVNLSKLFRITGSHCKTTIILLYQSFFRCIPLARRLSNVFIIYKLPDQNEMDLIARRIGINKKEFNLLFKKYTKTPYDSICFDKTSHTPAKIRLNIFQPIDYIEGDE